MGMLLHGSKTTKGTSSGRGRHDTCGHCANYHSRRQSTLSCERKKERKLIDEPPAACSPTFVMRWRWKRSGWLFAQQLKPPPLEP
eukprot:3415067-Rhodomonas_salina.1